MRHLITSVFLAVFLACPLLLPQRAAAQTPDTGMTAAGASVGVFFPDEAFESTVTLDGFGEYYLGPRVSIRGLFGWANPGVEGRTEDHVRQVKLLFNAVYNWELGAFHPFATAGAGAYFVRLKRDDRDDPAGETRGGLNFGGGAEYFVGARTTVKGELRLDVVSHPTDLPDATGWSLTFGVKQYF